MSKQSRSTPIGRDASPRALTDLPPISTGPVTIDPARFRVTVHGERAHVTYLEFLALYLIASGHGRVIEYSALGDALWGLSGDQARRRLAVLLSRVRSKLGVAAACIETVPRVGYRLAPVA